MTRARLSEALRESLVTIPALFVSGAIALSVIVSIIDVRTSFGQWLFRGDPQSARTLLAAVATGAVTLMGLVFSVTMLVVQLTSSQYSPRVLRTFLRDRNSHYTLAVFAGTFAFALATLRAVDADSAPPTAVALAVVFAFITLAVFMQYINHVARRIRVNAIIDSVADDARRSIGAFLERARSQQHAPAPPRASTWHPVHARQPGYVIAVEQAALLALAVDLDAFIDVRVAAGSFVREGAILLEVSAADASDAERFLRHIEIGRERTPDHDPLYGLRQLVDIAQRALSPSLNDPTTATQVVDALHDLLARLAPNSFPAGVQCDGDGTARVWMAEPVWEDFLDLAVDEIELLAAEQVQVLAGLERMLDDLATVARDDRTPSIAEKQLRVKRSRSDLDRRL